MRELWSEVEKRRQWRRIWVALAETQSDAGLVKPAQVDDLKAHVDHIDLERAAIIEAEIHHDVMAEVRTFAEQCPVGGGIIHLGATSMDISDNAEVLRQRAALQLIQQQLKKLLSAFADRIDQWAEKACMGWTHLQPAEPTTVGYRLATYTQDLLEDHHNLVILHQSLKGKGFKGAVGTSASYVELLQGTDMTASQFDASVMARLGLEAFPIAGQTYPRRQDWMLINGLVGLAGTLYRFAFDLRLMQSPAFGEWSEPFSEKQVGSSAMPFKRNPINAENIDSLARLVSAFPAVVWNNAAHSLLERTLDDSANRRTIIPEAFLALDSMLATATKIVQGLRLDENAIIANMNRYGLFAATERVLMALGRAGADRQEMHERIRTHSLLAWSKVQAGETNPLLDLIIGDQEIGAFLNEGTLRQLMNASAYIGDAPDRAHALVDQVRLLLI